MIFTKEEAQQLINVEHFEKGRSIRSIERDMGVGKTTLNSTCKRYGIEVKSRLQSLKDNEKHVIRASGCDHWVKNRPDLAKKYSKESSKRMLINNPMDKIENIKKSRQTIINTFRNNPTQHESLFADILDSLCIEYTTQNRIITYNADFIIGGNTTVELDGRGHARRKTKDAKRDQLLCQSGFNVIRINQDSLWDKRRFPDNIKPGKLLSIIKKYVPFVDTTSIDPSFLFGKYRVLVREAHTGTEIVY